MARSIDSGLGWLRPPQLSQAAAVDPFATALVIVGVVGAAALAWFGRPALLDGGRGRLPRRFEVSALERATLPVDARQPLAYLSECLGKLGFGVADLPVRVPAVAGFGRHLLLVPFVHPQEKALFLMGIESRLVGQSPIMLHIITPLSGERRVETSTLVGLRALGRPPNVDAQVVADADTVEEIWSRHRLALTHHERSERLAVAPGEWRVHAARAYEAWLQSALSAQRLTLSAAGDAYVIR